MKKVKYIKVALIALSLVVTSTTSYGALYDAIKKDRARSSTTSRSKSAPKNSLFSGVKQFYNLNTHNQLKNGNLACGSGRSKYQHCN